MDTCNMKFISRHFYSKPKSFGDSPMGRWVTGRTDAMALTSRRRSFWQTIHAEVRQNVDIRKSASPLRRESKKRYTVVVNFNAGRNKPDKMIPPKVWDPERRDVTAHSWREPRLISGARRGGKGGRKFEGVPLGTSTGPDSSPKSELLLTTGLFFCLKPDI